MHRMVVKDVTLRSTDGLHVPLRRSKTDREVRGSTRVLPCGPGHLPALS